MLNQQQLEDDLNFLAATDEEAARLAAQTERLEAKARAVKDAIFLCEQGTVAERSAKAGASKEYADAMMEYFDSLEASGAVKNKRQTAGIRIDAWRSLNANRRQAA